MSFFRGIRSIFRVFPVFCPESRQPKTSVKKQKGCKNNFDFLGKVLKSWTDKHKNAKYEIQKNDEPREIPGEFLHGGYR